MRTAGRYRWTGLACLILLTPLRAEEQPTEEGGEETPVEIWTDQPQAWINEALFNRVVWLDSIFYTDPPQDRRDPRSRFRLRVYSQQDWGARDRFFSNASLSASVRLPGLTDRFRLILDPDELDAFPGRDRDDAENRPFLALRRLGTWVNTDIGAKLNNPPEAFARLTAHTSWEHGPLNWHAQHRLYAETKEKLGMLATLSQHCWLNENWLAGHGTSIRWSQITTGVEAQDSLSLMRVMKMIEDSRQGQFIGHSDISHGAGVRLSVNAAYDNSFAMTRYQATFVYRRPLFRRDYLHWELNPTVNWREEDDWEPEYSVRLGLDILFWHDR